MKNGTVMFITVNKTSQADQQVTGANYLIYLLAPTDYCFPHSEYSSKHWDQVKQRYIGLLLSSQHSKVGRYVIG